MRRGINKFITEKTCKLIGEEHVNNFTTKRIAVLGLGGVGGTALEALTRTGFSKFVLVDADRVEYSNLNRQILFNTDDVELRKVDVAASHLGILADGIEIATYATKITTDNVHEILDEHHLDFIVDAIDDVKAKVALIKYAQEKHIPIIVSVGMGNRLDPTLIEMLPLSKTTDDGLARALRQQCRAAGIDPATVMTVHSKEHPILKSETPYSMMMVPSAAGLFICYHVVRYFMDELLEKEEN